MSERRKSLCQGLSIIHISAWSSIPDRPLPLKRDCLLVDHTHVYQSVFNNGATDWRYFIVIISRTDVLFTLIWTCLQARVGDSQEFTQEVWQTELWLVGLRNVPAAYRT